MTSRIVSLLSMVLSLPCCCCNWSGNAGGCDESMGVLTVCAQTDQCKDAINTATQTAFLTLTSSNAEFDFFCEN